MISTLYTFLRILLVGLVCAQGSGSSHGSVRHRRSKTTLGRLNLRLGNLELLFLEEQDKNRQLQIELSTLKEGDLYEIKKTLGEIVSNSEKCGCPIQEVKPASSPSSVNVLVDTIEQGLREEKTSRIEMEDVLEIVKTRQEYHQTELEIVVKRQEDHQADIELVAKRQQDHQTELEIAAKRQQDHQTELETLKDVVLSLRLNLSDMAALQTCLKPELSAGISLVKEFSRSVFSFNETVMVRCTVDTQYLQGSGTLRCGHSGQWEGHARCVTIPCSDQGPTVQTVIGGVKSILRLSAGSGEETMIRLAPTVYAMTYLQSTKQTLKDDSIEKAGHTFIQKGYNRELTFRKKDGSFAVFSTYPSSTWLTAFVLKVFCQAREYADIDENVICTGVEWLVKQQADDGRYTEPYKVYHQEMIGGVNGDVSLSAFVLIALQECSCRTEQVSQSMNKALAYLETQLDNVERPFSFAIISYALALADSSRKLEAIEALCTLSEYDKGRSTRYWPVGTKEQFGNQKLPFWFTRKPTALSVETTAYALLAQLTLGGIKESNSVVNWLTQQRNSKGAFVSTQDTVVTLQALSLYANKTYSEKLDLTSHLTSTDNPRFKRDLHLHQDHSLVQKLVDKVPVGSKMYVATKGTGVGQMPVELSYNIPPDADNLCRFQLEVQSEQIEFSVIPKENCDVCGQECAEPEEYIDYDFDYEGLIEPVARSAVDHAELHKKPSRVGREAVPSRARIGGDQREEPVQKAAKIGGASKVAICIEACTRSLTGNATGMSIIEVGLFTGFTPIEDDLNKIISAGTAQKFEKTSNSVIFYVDSIPDEDVVCVKFRAKQDHRVGNIQPVAVNVYDYYNPTDDVCTKFYSPKSESGLLQNRCDGDVCKYVEGKCSKCYQKEERRALKMPDLKSMACEQADYVYKVKIDKLEEPENKFGSRGVAMIKVVADLKDVIKGGGQKFFDNDQVIFWIVKSCECPELTPGKVYLVMGKDGQRYADETGRERFKYDLDNEAFVMGFFDKNNHALNRDDRRLGYYMERLGEDLKGRGVQLESPLEN